MGAFAAVLGSFILGHVFWGVLCAIVAGIFMGLLFAEFHLRRPGDAIVGVNCTQSNWSWIDYIFT